MTTDRKEGVCIKGNEEQSLPQSPTAMGSWLPMFWLVRKRAARQRRISWWPTARPFPSRCGSAQSID